MKVPIRVSFIEAGIVMKFVKTVQLNHIENMCNIFFHTINFLTTIFFFPNLFQFNSYCLFYTIKILTNTSLSAWFLGEPVLKKNIG